MRKRKHISLKTKLASALACLLTQEERDFVRANRRPAGAILKLFEFDHVVLHAPPFNGSDEWWNLDPKLIGMHREKSRRDTSIVAKVKRLNGTTRKRQKRAIASRIDPWPPRGSRKMSQNRPF